jgi:two-component system, chemotaxis family, CheB/CheR fusion protein
LRNVGKHAGKTHVKISLKGTNGGVEMEIADFGQGFDQDHIHRGLGLVALVQNGGRG